MSYVKHPPERIYLQIHLSGEADYKLKELLINDKIVGEEVHGMINSFLWKSDYLCPSEEGGVEWGKKSPDELELTITVRLPINHHIVG